MISKMADGEESGSLDLKDLREGIEADSTKGSDDNGTDISKDWEDIGNSALSPLASSVSMEEKVR